MKQNQLFIVLCAVLLAALWPSLGMAQNKEVRMELVPKTVDVGEQPIDFYDDGGPEGKTSAEFKEGKESHVTFVPQVAGKKVQIDFKQVDIFEGNLYSQYIRVYDGAEVNPSRLLATVRKGTTPVVKALNPQGTLTVAFGSTTAFTSNGFKAVVSLFAPQPMRYIGVDVSPMKDATLVAGDKAQPMLGINIRTEDTEPALTLNALALTLNGPIAGVQLYQGASATDFSTAHRLAETTPMQGATTLTLGSPLTLRPGDNFFWLGCDVADEAKNGNTLSLVMNALTLSDGQHALSAPLPTGERLVDNVVFALEGEQQYRVNNSLVFRSKTNTYNDNYEGGNRNRIVSFTPLHPGHVVQVDFSQFDLYYSANANYGARATFVVYEGVGTTGRKLWELTSAADKQRGPSQTLRSQAADGGLTIVFNPNDSHYAAKGFVARVSEYAPHAMSLASVDVRQASTEGVVAGAPRQPLLLVNLRTDGNLQPIALQNMVFDLKNALPAMSALHLFAQPTINPDAAPSGKPLATLSKPALAQRPNIALAEPLTLAEGDNWLLLCADVAEDAQSGQSLDAALLSVNTSLGETAVQQGDPQGERPVVNERALTKGDNGRIELAQNATLTLYDDGGKDKSESKGFEGHITFVPKTAGTVIALTPKAWSLTAADKLEVFFGTAIKDKADLVFSRNDRFERLLSTAPNGAITLRYTTGKFVVSEGFAIEVSAITPQPLSLAKLKTIAAAPAKVFKGQTDVPLLHVVANVAGDLGQLALTQMRATLQGTAPIGRALVYATGSSDVFSTAELLVQGDADNGVFNTNYIVNKPGEYHFWLAADMATTAQVGQTLTASLADATFGGNIAVPETAETASTTVAQGISGTLNVGANATYTTIQQAVDALKAGIDGSVTISIESGKYNERVYITAIPGLSPSNTLTLKPASGKRGDVVIFHDRFSTDGYHDDQLARNHGVVTISEAPYTTLQALEITTTDVKYPSVVHLRNESRNVTVDDCYLHAPYTSNTQDKVTLMNMYAPDRANANNDYFTLSNSLLEGGYIGVRLGGTTTVALPQQRGGRILNNTLRNQGTKAIYVARETDARIEGNTIENDASDHADFNAIDIDATGDSRISCNRISLATKNYCSAIFVRKMEGTLVAHAQIVNNAVWVKHNAGSARRNASRALLLRGESSALEIANNTLCMEGNEKDVVVGVQGKTGSSIMLVNNLLQNNGKGLVYQFTRKEALSSFTLSNNNIYTNGSTLGAAGSNAATLAAWAALSGERYTYNNKVEFATDVLLQPLSEDGLRHGRLVFGVDTDILGIARNTTMPLIGAYEHAWQSPSTGIATPASSANDIRVSVENGVLSLSELPQYAKVEVFSTNGLLLARHTLSPNANNMQLTNLPQGVLVVRVTWANGRWSKAIKN